MLLPFCAMKIDYCAVLGLLHVPRHNAVIHASNIVSAIAAQSYTRCRDLSPVHTGVKVDFDKMNIQQSRGNEKSINEVLWKMAAEEDVVLTSAAGGNYRCCYRVKKTSAGTWI